jgi:ADP-ribose pyrophosphatase
MTDKPGIPVPADALPRHADLEILQAEIGFSRHSRVDVVRFRHRRFDGAWSGERVFDVIRRGPAVAILLYDPDLDRIVLIEQFRLAALYGGRSPWQLEAVAGLVDSDETPEEVARRETREEADLDPIGPLLPIQKMMPASGSLDEVIWLFCGRVDSGGAGGVHGLAEEHEDIRVVVKEFAEVEALLDGGTVESAHTLVMLSWLLRHRDRLRREWSKVSP